MFFSQKLLSFHRRIIKCENLKNKIKNSVKSKKTVHFFWLSFMCETIEIEEKVPVPVFTPTPISIWFYYGSFIWLQFLVVSSLYFFLFFHCLNTVGATFSGRHFIATDRFIWTNSWKQLKLPAYANQKFGLKSFFLERNRRFSRIEDSTNKFYDAHQFHCIFRTRMGYCTHVCHLRL